jgi:tetratricopeptide (TPR) repeat protein/DNA-binding CsgD family transcriptional regulator
MVKTMPMFFKKQFFPVIFTIVCTLLSGQHTEKLDSLFFELETVRSDSARISILIGISGVYSAFDLPLSLQYAQDGLAVAEKSKDIDLMAQANLSVGSICFMQGLLELSAKHFHEALRLFEQINNTDGVARVKTNLGGLHLQLYKFEEAKVYLKEALELFNSIGTNRGDTIPPSPTVSIYNNLGIAYENLEDYNKAIEFYSRGISLAKRMPSQEKNLAMLHNNLGSTFMKRGRAQEALENMKEALRIRSDISDKAGIAASHRMIGIFHFSQNNLPLAIQNLKLGFDLANEVGSTPILSGTSEKLFEIYRQTNQADSALRYHILFKEYSDKLKSEETLKELTRLEVVSQYMEKEKLQEAEKRRQALRHLLISSTLVLSLIILSLLFFLSQSRVRRLNLKNKNIQLASENAELERENLSRELEMKSKELTTNVIYQIRKNELINAIAEKLISNSKNFRKENQVLIEEIIKDLGKAQDESIWEEFESRFHEVHNHFYNHLNEINPDLTLNERRLCAFLRLNMTTKEISSITGQSLRSIDVARTRLRKKINLTNTDQGLVEYLSNL